MKFLIMPLIVLSMLTVGCQPKEESRTLVIYSARGEKLLKPLIDAYQKKDLELKVEYLSDDATSLMERLKAEGESTKADLLITVDVGNLWQAANQNLFDRVESEVLKKNIPENLRQSDNQWFGLSMRARTIVYSTERVKLEELSTYEDLASPKWEKRLCLRTSKKVYNQSLVASMIATLGEEKTEEVIKGWVKNLATDVFSSDDQVMAAILAGQCDVGIVNTYYFGRQKQEKPEAAMALFWPNQNDRGVHVNISGAGVTHYAKNRKDAILFLEWMTMPEAQRILADENQEYPVNPEVKPSEEVASWGAFKADPVNVEVAGKLQEAAIKLMDRAGYH